MQMPESSTFHLLSNRPLQLPTYLRSADKRACPFLMVHSSRPNLIKSIKSTIMCLACGPSWPWAHGNPRPPVKLYDPPVKEEVIYLEPGTGFYPDERKVRHNLCIVRLF